MCAFLANGSYSGFKSHCSGRHGVKDGSILQAAKIQLEDAVRDGTEFNLTQWTQEMVAAGHLKPGGGVTGKGSKADDAYISKALHRVCEQRDAEAFVVAARSCMHACCCY